MSKDKAASMLVVARGHSGEQFKRRKTALGRSEQARLDNGVLDGEQVRLHNGRLGGE